MRLLGFGAAALLFSVSPARAADVWSFSGRCSASTVKMGSVREDLGKAQGSSIACDVAILTQQDDGRRTLQFRDGRRRQTTPLAFSGVAVGPVDNTMMRLPVDRIYPRRSPHATPEEAFAQARSLPVEGDGSCSFQGTDFARVTGINCVSTIVNGSRKIIYRIDYAVTEVSMMPNKPSP